MKQIDRIKQMEVYLDESKETNQCPMINWKKLNIKNQKMKGTIKIINIR